MEDHQSLIADAIAKLDDAEKKLIEARQQVHTLAKRIAPLIWERDELIRVARFLYWDCPEIPAKEIADHFFQCTIQELKQFIGPLTINVHCGICKIPLTMEVTSRTQRQERLHRDRDQFKTRAWTWHRCDSCKAQEQARQEEWNATHQSYEERLTELQTMPYFEYLQTPEWDQKRKAHLRSSKYRCQICNTSGPLHVHHRTYENRGNEQWADLIALCADCHSHFHNRMEVQT